MFDENWTSVCVLTDDSVPETSPGPGPETALNVIYFSEIRNESVNVEFIVLSVKQGTSPLLENHMYI